MTTCNSIRCCAGFRQSEEYPALLAQAKQCQDRFIAERAAEP